MLIYRAISGGEKNDLHSSNRFNLYSKGLEAKLFTERLEDAITFKNEFELIDSEEYFIVEVEIDDVYSKNLGYYLLDEGLLTSGCFTVDKNELNNFNKNMSFKILNL